MTGLTWEERDELHRTAQFVGARPDDLDAVIAFESRWDPQARNPRSSAAGLLQWLDSTARVMGYASSAALVAQHPTRIAQLRGPVRVYLGSQGPFPTLQSLAMAVFYPRFREVDPSREFPPEVQAVNPGIRTVGDYLARVRPPGSRVIDIARSSTGNTIGALFLGLVLVWVLSR